MCFTRDPSSFVEANGDDVSISGFSTRNMLSVIPNFSTSIYSKCSLRESNFPKDWLRIEEFKETTSLSGTPTTGNMAYMNQISCGRLVFAFRGLSGYAESESPQTVGSVWVRGKLQMAGPKASRISVAGPVIGLTNTPTLTTPTSLYTFKGKRLTHGDIPVYRRLVESRSKSELKDDSKTFVKEESKKSVSSVRHFSDDDYEKLSEEPLSPVSIRGRHLEKPSLTRQPQVK